jgi:Mrp family chromosome partitioning ATPase
MNNENGAAPTTTETPSDTPSDANAGCVGPADQDAGKASACAGCPNQEKCAGGAFNSPEAQAAAQQQVQALQTSLHNVSHTILVLSGKGGVGKSTVASQLCHTLALQGYAVGLLDVDLTGPSAPRMVLGDAHTQAQVTRSGSGAWTPVYASPNLACMSISFLLQDHDAAVVWRGPRKNGLIQQFLTEVDWTGDTDGLDYLIIDTPPGTSDEHISTVQYLQKAGSVSGAIVVTTPEEMSMADVRKELNFCHKTSVPVLGIVENMSKFQTCLRELQFETADGADVTQQILKELQEKCPQVLETMVTANIFTATGGGPKAMAEQYGIEYWGVLPLDPNLLECCEEGKSMVENFPSSTASKSLVGFCQRITDTLPVEEVGGGGGDGNKNTRKNNNEQMEE